MTLPAASVLVVAGLVPGVGRAVCWVVAIVVIFGGGRLISTEGWRIEPAHFAAARDTMSSPLTTVSR